ncbi:hypothetical protein JJV70_09180 [Streptomyces sp. JJ66]|uniref:DUF7848 domain-containing protein n=1 Tax=Streptomyces sp. JJ66 TaxID=2803843 RepID=UPI001C5689A9|nr:hypothetical protein [Streptomyces sp. JJ66]MBW1602279.1 hypothetical protein [Streptomyces sp. JJ66]
MIRESYRFRRFRVQADEEPDADPRTYTARCAVCGLTGPTVEAVKEESPEARAMSAEAARRAAAEWIPRHRDHHREHFSYHLLESTPYRVVPGEWL